MKYYKNTNNELFIDPIVKNHIGLVEITVEEFNAILEAQNNPPKTEEQLFSEKWNIINNYLDNTIPNFINEITENEFMIKTADLLWIEKESKEWTDEESYPWIQFGIPTFKTDKNELKMAITDAKNKRQNKIAEIFELGA